MRVFFRGGLCGAWLLFLLQAGAAGAEGGGGRTTVVQPGEDCRSLVRRVYGGTPGAMAHFHAANPQLGGLPHLLHAGDVVAIPALHGRPGTHPARHEREDPPRLSYVGPAVRTQGGREDVPSEALPDQPVQRRMRIFTSPQGGAEINLPGRAHVQVLPESAVVVDALPERRSAGALSLLGGALSAGTENDRAPLKVHTPAAEIRLRGGARVETVAPGMGEPATAVSIYRGSATVRGRGREVEVTAGSGTLVVKGERPARPRGLPAAPAWTAAGPALRLLVQARGRHAAARADVVLGFVPVLGAAGYLVEVARDARFNDQVAAIDAAGPPFTLPLGPGTYHARVSALAGTGPEGKRLFGPPSAARLVRVVAVRSDAELVAAQEHGLVLRGEQGASVVIDPSGPGTPARGRNAGPRLLVSLDGALLRPGPDSYAIRLGPGEHRLRLALAGAAPVESYALAVQVAYPALPGMGAADHPVEPIDLPVPLTSPGFPVRALHPRTRAYALFSLGASGAEAGGTAPGLDTYRLDLGGEFAFLQRRMAVDLDLPVLYYDYPGRGAPAFGDLGLGFKTVAVSAFDGRLAFGPLLRLQLPTGSFYRAGSPGAHPVVIDPALGLAGVIGPVGLLTTQGPTAVVSLPGNQLRWSMSYAATARLGRFSLGAGLDAAIGLAGGAGSGAALGGGARVDLQQAAALQGWRVLLGARGGLGDGGQQLFGRYQVVAGVEWER